jgi:hypothetical protein
MKASEAGFFFFFLKKDKGEKRRDMMDDGLQV